MGEQFGVQRRLAVVEVPLRQDPDHVVEVEVSRVGTRCREIVAPISDDQPRPGIEKILAAQFGKGGLDARVGDPRRGYDLLRVSAPHQAEFRFPIHLPPPAIRKPRSWMRGAGR
jgi:hypothetical protein